MPFVDDILKHRSLSIVGMGKNTGKTVCLNYILRRLDAMHVGVGVTSIGVDGEQTDAVLATAKPEITLFEGMHFITSEVHYLQRRVVSCIEATDERRTALGIPVMARVEIGGKVMLSGAATTESLLRQIAMLQGQGCRMTIVDGALSRLSLASPAVTEAMVLATGAAVSSSLPTLVSKTRFLCRLIGLEPVDTGLAARLGSLGPGIWAVDGDGSPAPLGISSTFLVDDASRERLQHSRTLFASGAVSDRLLKSLSAGKEGTTLVVRDFTRLFVSPEAYGEFTRRGGAVRVLQRPHLVAVVLNPTSPQGFAFDSGRARAALSEALGRPVYDIMKIEQ